MRFDKRVMVAVAALLVAAGCGVGIDHQKDASGPSTTDGGSDFSPEAGASTDASAPTTLPPPTDLVINGDTGAPVNRVAANAIADLNAFWGAVYPATFDGAAYVAPAGGYFAVDRNSRPSTLPCQPYDVNQVLHNAYFCPSDDAIAWDEEFLMPELAETFGDFTVAVVLAHEFGHAIQHRAAFEQPTVVMELQADCYAGAWAKHVADSGTSRFEIGTRELDQALAGILSFRDAAGASSEDPNAHGSGFDRVSAFQVGYEEGSGRCRGFTVGDPRPFQFQFEGDDRYTLGDRPQDEMVDQAFRSLDAYWADVFPALSGGRAWEPMAAPRPFTLDDPPTCNGAPATGFRLFLCVPERYIGYESEETIPQAYDKGDFAVGALFGTQYGMEVQDQLQKPPGDEVTATLRADCFTGAWAAAMLPERQTDPALRERYVLTLSPGDLDEGVKVLLTFRTAADRERQGPGFNRVKAYRTGVLSGPGACVDLKA
ncbi:MAG: neutral zinc metallopeptidase [Acidimicrobiales bacterium]